MKTYEFAYGRSTKKFTIDEELVIKEVVTQPFPVLSVIKSGVLEAFYIPIGCEPFDRFF